MTVIPKPNRDTVRFGNFALDVLDRRLTCSGQPVKLSSRALDILCELAAAGGVAHNPKGPDSSFDPSEPDQPKKAHRGGSFLCTDQYCSRYIVGTRGKGEVSTGTNHLGFRCVKDASQTNQSDQLN